MFLSFLNRNNEISRHPPLENTKFQADESIWFKWDGLREYMGPNVVVDEGGRPRWGRWIICVRERQAKKLCIEVFVMGCARSIVARDVLWLNVTKYTFYPIYITHPCFWISFEGHLERRKGNGWAFSLYGIWYTPIKNEYSDESSAQVTQQRGQINLFPGPFVCPPVPSTG